MDNFNSPTCNLREWGYARPNDSFSNLNCLEQIDVQLLSSNFMKSRPCLSDKGAYCFNLDSEIFLKSLQLSPPAIDLLQMRTTSRSESSPLREERRKRLPASSFGQVFHLGERTSRRRLTKGLLYSDHDVKATNEQEAIEAYRNEYADQVVRSCGFFVHPQFGYLGATPDALVGDEGLLEVKCPYTANPDYLQKIQGGGDWKRRLKLNHNYYYQIQGKLEVTDRKFCDFFVWTPHGGVMHLERIFRDQGVWEKIFPKLERFYKLSLLPELVDPRIPRRLILREPDFVFRAREIRII